MAGPAGQPEWGALRAEDGAGGSRENQVGQGSTDFSEIGFADFGEIRLH
jgi:hypothetical protein